MRVNMDSRREVGLAELVEGTMLDADSSGRAETALEQTRAIAGLVGRLVEGLVEKGVLDLADVKAFGVTELVVPDEDEG